jgi:hypothetical protein
MFGVAAFVIIYYKITAPCRSRVSDRTVEFIPIAAQAFAIAVSTDLA